MDSHQPSLPDFLVGLFLRDLSPGAAGGCSPALPILPRRIASMPQPTWRMKMKKALMVVGSLRKQSFNRTLARALAKMAPPGLSLTELTIGDIPLYNQDMESSFPDVVLRMKDEIRKADGILFVTPEYNRSIPGVLKNVIDWGSRPYGESAWRGKPAAIAGATPGPIGTAAAQAHLRSVLGILEMPLMGQPEIYLQVKDGLFDAQADCTDASTEKILRKFVEGFARWVETSR
jgi:chromate reductase, NAD(P)H dehydrogenase (quinone)